MLENSGNCVETLMNCSGKNKCPLFSGKDGSRAFVTGQFNEEGLTDDISDFTPHQMHEIHDWKQFYSNSYTYLGWSAFITVPLHLPLLPRFICSHYSSTPPPTPTWVRLHSL